jgi:serine/threonine protein phosphatase PrpC
MLHEDEIARTLQAQTEPEQACTQLVALANEVGDKDNITVMVAQFHAASQAETPAQTGKAREVLARGCEFAAARR